jgi:hypothetical protein
MGKDENTPAACTFLQSSFPYSVIMLWKGTSSMDFSLIIFRFRPPWLHDEKIESIRHSGYITGSTANKTCQREQICNETGGLLEPIHLDVVGRFPPSKDCN